MDVGFDRLHLDFRARMEDPDTMAGLEGIRALFSFLVVRHPFERLLSAYRFVVFNDEFPFSFSTSSFHFLFSGSLFYR